MLYTEDKASVLVTEILFGNALFYFMNIKVLIEMK